MEGCWWGGLAAAAGLRVCARGVGREVVSAVVLSSGEAQLAPSPSLSLSYTHLVPAATPGWSPVSRRSRETWTRASGMVAEGVKKKEI